MSAVALQPIHDLRASLTLTPDLAVWVCAVEDGAEPPEGLPPAVVAEAQRLALQVDRLMAPVREKVLDPWLSMAVAHYGAVRRAMDPETTLYWLRTTKLALEGMPVGVFTQANLGEILATFAWLPSASQFMEVLGPDRDKLETRARALRAVAGAARTGRGC